MPRLLVAALLFVVASAVTTVEAQTVEEVRTRVDHHLREADQIIRHFEDVVRADCPRFASRDEWRQYFDGEVDQATSLVAHVEQAWIEAKRVGDRKSVV